jgi:hypothetical protein
MWQRDLRSRGYAYQVRIPRNPWLVLFGIVAAGVAGAVVLALLVALIAVAATAALLIGGAYLAWQGTRMLSRPASRMLVGPGGNPSNGRVTREMRGLLELAGTPDPYEQYLLAVREFERISMAALEIEPEATGRGRSARRARDLTDQAENLADAVNEIERRLLADPHADGARTHVWELSLAVREVEHYLSMLANVRGAPGLAQLRRLVAARSTLTTRRTALVDRLDSAQVTRNPVITGG